MLPREYIGAFQGMYLLADMPRRIRARYSAKNDASEEQIDAINQGDGRFIAELQMETARSIISGVESIILEFYQFDKSVQFPLENDIHWTHGTQYTTMLDHVRYSTEKGDINIVVHQLEGRNTRQDRARMMRLSDLFGVEKEFYEQRLDEFMAGRIDTEDPIHRFLRAAFKPEVSRNIYVNMWMEGNSYGLDNNLWNLGSPVSVRLAQFLSDMEGFELASNDVTFDNWSAMIIGASDVVGYLNMLRDGEVTPRNLCNKEEVWLVDERMGTYEVIEVFT